MGGLFAWVFLNNRDGGGDVADARVVAEFVCFGVAAAQEAGIDDASAVVPEVKLCDSLREMSFVYIAEQGGVPEVGTTDVEGKVDEGVELRLRELDGDGFVDAVGGGADIAEQESHGLFLGDGLAGVHAGGVAVADGPDAALVLIGGEEVALE